MRSYARDVAQGHRDGAVNTHLLRLCPCPVWLVGPQRVASRHTSWRRWTPRQSFQVRGS